MFVNLPKLTLLGWGGAESAHTFFKHPFLYDKKGSGGPKFRDFQKIKNFLFGFSQCFWVIQKVQADSAPPALKQHPEAPPY